MNQLTTKSNSLSKLDSINWDFEGDRSDSPFSELHFYPGLFLPQIPAALIGTMTQPGDVVLDPFCGSGTTLVEAQRLNRHALGIDLNPVACLIARAKTSQLSASNIEARITQFLTALAARNLQDSSAKSYVVPPSVQLTKWYHPETGRQLSAIWEAIQLEEDVQTKELLLFCFSASLISCCAETRSWGYICDNVKPLSYPYIDAYSIFIRRAESLVEAFYRRQGRSPNGADTMFPLVSVIEGDAASTLKNIEDESVDLVITSPPYFGVVDYIKAQRLSFEWFDFELEKYRREEIGARSKRLRGSALEQYLNELRVAVLEIHRVLKREHSAVFVIGESESRQGTLQQFLQLLRDCGLIVESDITRRVGQFRKQRAYIAKEQIIICRKA